ncbi:MAG: 1-deoxy-D-xylulose-5-phosphate synthase [Oscillospiraceae bacterium]|nr:1-deoxy-D-xylulose-5-phosphate synthase [Oscillospiraceae bacterium]
MKSKILEKISEPEDLKKLNINELKQLAKEIREKIIKVVCENGGHLASNLGTVELTIALHRVFNSPNDKIIWDVGHQSYTHKLLTGRVNQFYSLRKWDGISGLIRPSESEHDIFISGHSSIAVSAALGFAKANEIAGKSDYVVSVIGDGSLTGGQIFEGLNNSGVSAKNFIVILNDNNMAINKNQGGLANYLDKIRLNTKYWEFKGAFAWFLGKLPLGKPLICLLRKFKAFLKSLLYPKNIFENLGFNYIGPVNGHNIKNVLCALERAKKYAKPVVVHVNTKKGKGHKLAEEQPDKFHNVVDAPLQRTFSSEFGKAMVKFAETNSRICAITAAMRDSVGLFQFSQTFSERFFDVGIAEQHAVTFAAGLAESGLTPVVAVCSTFLQRAYDQLLHDVSISNSHVVLAIDRAGFVGGDGETHHGLFDVVFLSGIPNTTIYAPLNYAEQRHCLKLAIDGTGLCAVRYPKGEEINIPELINVREAEYAYLQQSKKDILVVTYGRISSFVVNSLEYFKKLGISVSLLRMIKIHPVEAVYLEIACEYRTVIFLEEGIKSGSVAEQFGSKLAEIGAKVNYFVRAVDNGFVPHGNLEEQLGFVKLDAENVKNFIKSVALSVSSKINVNLKEKLQFSKRLT